MGKIAVIYWSSGGNTEAMANAIAKGIASQDVCAEVYTVSEFGGKNLNDYEKFALGCPSMGVEVLEESEFEPFVASVEKQLSGEKIALFGSYGWGDGEWMRNWEKRMLDDGCLVFETGLIINLTPDEEGIKKCEEFGARFAKF
ncbi:flavodoxin [Synergistes jonesii]|uniref:Flavodoxin n=1 Tax=Synergistes jonesii TaxID=2754 RepID=A0A073IP91_9BACT|nr:flavodoxin [Synergistes jonesii]KEJ91311.1 flavodoxin [Synergistes jonesii]OFB60380.1 flavodoxin [Synergistes jonesii]OFB61205.1 flavodoxin [Synergistes jonesii]OFB62912.1 flavodoxin [Synergistes jonesii]OFB66591.1 flavodoxin [Synergistes jonesii]